MKFEACGLLTKFWFCLPSLFELMTLSIICNLQEVSLPALRDSIMEALKVLVGNESETSSFNFEMQIFCFYIFF